MTSEKEKIFIPDFSHERSATNKLLRKLTLLLGKDQAKEIYNDFTMDIIRADHEFRYGVGGMKPHVGRISFPIVCGNREMIFKRRPGGEIEILFMDHNRELKHAYDGIHRLRFQGQFNELWDLFLAQRDRYIKSLGDIQVLEGEK